MEQNAEVSQTLEKRLDKIRSSPHLQSQQQTRVVLAAVEETLREQGSHFTPTAYFAALLSLLSQHATTQSSSGEAANAVVYLLDLITPHVPAPLLRSKFVLILSSVAPALARPEADAPFVRASIGTLASLLVAQDGKAWSLPTNQPGPRQALAGLLKLAVDPRPKVRKRAQEAVGMVLERKPPSPSIDHPAADMCTETALQTFETLAKSLNTSKRQHDTGFASEPALIHAMQLVKIIIRSVGRWPSRGLESLTLTLFAISRSRNEHLATTAFEIFENVFSSMANADGSEKLPFLLDAMAEVQPSQSDTQLLPPWIAVISRGYDVYSQVDGAEACRRLPRMFSTVSAFLASPSFNIRTSASECLVSFLVNCIPANVILKPSVMDLRALEKLAVTMNGLFDTKYQASRTEIFTVLGAMLENFRWHSNTLLDEAIQTVGELRASESFQHKEKADRVLACAVRYMGPESVLKILPLNLGLNDAKKQGRAWLIPIIRDSVANTSLSHFKRVFIPLSEKLFQKAVDVGERKTTETKILETLIEQIWSCLPGYCDRPTDCVRAFDQSFGEVISNLLYAQTNMRNDICRALQNLVDGYNSILAEESRDDLSSLVANNGIDKDAAQQQLDHLSSYAANLLAVLFNVYGGTLPQHRAPVLGAINAYLSITSSSELSETFHRVASTFESSFEELTAKAVAKPGTKPERAKKGLPPLTHALLDIIVTCALYLPRESFQRLFLIASAVISQQHEPQLQKKAYKLIPRLAQSPAGSQAIWERSSELQAMLVNSADATLAPARKDRLAALAEVVKTLPNSDLTFVLSIVPEVILRTKETNERARESAYSLIVTIGERMSAGGAIRPGQVNSSGPSVEQTEASIQEYFTILSAGLAGSTPHMISASVAAITRALFTFGSALSPTVLCELFDTMSLFLESPTREVVRSVLGFVKVAVITLSQEIIGPRLPELVPRLISWSHEHKANFRAKVKNILERMIRRFDADVVERHCPEDDKKLIANIRKTRERRKRQRKGDVPRPDEEDVASEGEVRHSFADEFDEAIYGSDDGSESRKGGDQANSNGPRARTQRLGQSNSMKRGNAYIHEDPTEPLDLLDRRAMSNISSIKPLGTHKIKKHSSTSQINADGRLLLDTNDSRDGGDGDGDDVDMADLDTRAETGSLEKGIDAYVEAIRGKHAMEKGRKGRFKIGNARGRDENVEMEDAESDMPGASGRREVGAPHGRRTHARRARDRMHAGRVGKGNTLSQRMGSKASRGRTQRAKVRGR